MMTLERPMSGGCRCGAVRFAATYLARASICYCRMCQKAFDGIGDALVILPDHDITQWRAQRGPECA